MAIFNLQKILKAMYLDENLGSTRTQRTLGDGAAVVAAYGDKNRLELRAIIIERKLGVLSELWKTRKADMVAMLEAADRKGSE